MTNLRAFTYGIIVGIVALAGSFVVMSAVAGVKWQPVVERALNQ